MSDNKPPSNVKLSDLKNAKERSDFVTSFGYDNFAALVNQDVKAKAAAAKQANEEAMARRRAK